MAGDIGGEAGASAYIEWVSTPRSLPTSLAQRPALKDWKYIRLQWLNHTPIRGCKTGVVRMYPRKAAQKLHLVFWACAVGNG